MRRLKNSSGVSVLPLRRRRFRAAEIEDALSFGRKNSPFPEEHEEPGEVHLLFIDFDPAVGVVGEVRGQVLRDAGTSRRSQRLSRFVVDRWLREPVARESGDGVGLDLEILAA